MNYRTDRYGNKLSILGYGCMRFPRKKGKIDMAETERQIMLAYREGVNYFDTAYIYPGSEAALGEILEKNGIRNEVKIATKLPHYLIKSREDAERMFAEELRRLRTDYVDYYLMHMLTDADTWARLVEMGIAAWLDEKKQNGQIRQVGFSYHGNSDAFCRLLDVYDWDFCMIQYNYMDEHSQAGRRGLHAAHAKGLPVMIMEPLRGGRLVRRLPERAKQLFASHPSGRTPAEWAFRWLWNQGEVTVVLSGMNSEAMLRENLATAGSVEVGELGEAENALLADVVRAINAGMKVGCTGCGYCMPCPKGVDIPGIFAAYNRSFAEGRFWSLVDYAMCTALRKNSAAASCCVGCGKCEQHCPQQIEIRQQLKMAQKQFEGPVFRVFNRVASRFTHF
ncbi:MAG: aldo/keto reductase [Clostridia bacterium]|nr:aldo/keto reductase [Clostridia bacterium]